MFQCSTADWLRLIRANGIGSKTLIPLITQSDSLDQLFQLSSQTFASKLNRALAQIDELQFEKDIAWLSQPDCHLISFTDDRYPELLRRIEDPPLALFVHGDADILGLPQIAIVGSRNPSKGGRDNAHAFARYLGPSGLTITSGMALGIDSEAHKGCLSAGTKTIAVTGTGPDRVYPASNRQLAHQIADQGAIITEFPPGTGPHPGHFPKRNRIISGLSLGCLVVEATQKSGSLITARLASEQGREVFAIPGSIHNPQSKGCHQLIKQGAKLVEDGQDIVEELSAMLSIIQPTFTENIIKKESASPIEDTTPDKEYSDLLDKMGWDPVSIEQIMETSDLKAEELSSMLLLLELQGHVSSAPGGYFSRIKPPE
ncbi:MAG: DNA-protecting protein DprA [Gammaproteobacteria bacterium]|nr:DNA-processing protein DprA [Gammaproteobacteria bacterium]NNJ90321.1 DNA-protecting protein DprA [Gammaproteobacteria bacterium]